MGMSRKRKCVLQGKRLCGRIMFFFLYRGMRVLDHYDTRMRREIAQWPVGRTIVLSMEEGGSKLCIQKVQGGIVRVGAILHPDIFIGFKSPDGAFQVLTGQVGTARAYAQNRFRIKGDIAEVMSVVRCMDLAEAYLFPGFMAKRILGRVPVKQIGSMRVYIHAILGV